MNLDLLLDEFPKEAVSWRAQTLNKDGTSAMALAYIDARDVMRRLDAACGTGWQDSYTETPKGRIICTISLLIDGQWISRSDGAGDTDVEGEKGAISDAFKRAAVKWGIGRYLYDMPAPWVPCESYERNGKRVWSKWTEDPWKYVRRKETSPFESAAKRNAFTASVLRIIDAALTLDDMDEIKADNADMFKKMDAGGEYDKIALNEMRAAYKRKLSVLEEEAQRMDIMKEQLAERT